jgi:transcription elongation factor GreA
MNKSPITKEGHRALTSELKNLISKEKPEIIKAIASARELGDLSENADYHAARERHSFIEGRIAYLENRLATVEVIDISRLKGSKVVFGATVEIEDLDTGENLKYRIVGEDEADIKNRTISFSSPVARALIGKEPGDDVQVKTPKGLKEYTILNVLYK